MYELELDRVKQLFKDLGYSEGESERIRSELYANGYVRVKEYVYNYSDFSKERVVDFCRKSDIYDYNKEQDIIEQS